MTQRETLPMFGEPVRPAERPIVREKARQNARGLRVLAYLQAHGSATNVELSTPECGGLRAVGRIDELREDWIIEKAHVHKGIWRYTLKGKR